MLWEYYSEEAVKVAGGVKECFKGQFKACFSPDFLGLILVS